MNMNIDEQTIDAPCIPNLKYDDSGRLVGITVEEWFDKLVGKLITHYGDDFRIILNQARDCRQPYNITRSYLNSLLCDRMENLLNSFDSDELSMEDITETIEAVRQERYENETCV